MKNSQHEHDGEDEIGEYRWATCSMLMIASVLMVLSVFLIILWFVLIK